MEQEGTSSVPSRFFAQFYFPRAGEQTLAAANPQHIVLQIYCFNLIHCHQIGPVCADKAVSQSDFQFIETAQKFHPAVGGMEQNMVGDGGGFKKEDIAQGDMTHRFPCPQGEHFRWVLAFCQ